MEVITRFHQPMHKQKLASIVSDIGRKYNPDFHIDNDNKFAYNHFVAWILGSPQMLSIDINTGKEKQGNLYQGMYICGNTGSGKSLLVKVMLEFAKHEEIKYGIRNYLFDFAWWQVKADKICDYYSRNGDLYDFEQEYILCIDDLGCESNESVYMGNRINVLRQLLEYRLDEPDKLTIITRNLKINSPQFAQKYGDRVVSRLQQCNYYELQGQDRRIKH